MYQLGHPEAGCRPGNGGEGGPAPGNDGTWTECHCEGTLLYTAVTPRAHVH